MKVFLIKRKKVVHAGVKITDYFDNKVLTITVCKRNWYCYDEVSDGESEEITCKRCQKYAKEAEENDGKVILKPIIRRR